MAKNLAGTTIPPGNGGVVYPSPNEWPVTYKVITGITNGLQAVITAMNHGFTNSDIPVTQVDFSQVKGMQEINGKFGFITRIIDANNFQVDIDTTKFHAYQSGGFVNVNAGNPPYDPFQNLFP